MPQFKPITVEDKSLVEKHICACFGTTESAFLDLFIWGERYNTSVAFEDGFMFVRTGSGENIAYLFPCGDGDLRRAILTLRDDAEKNGVPFRMVGVCTCACKRLESTFPGRFSFSETRDSFDYVYTSQSLIELAGKKLHSKRTNINKFMAEYGERYVFEEINASNLDEVYAFQRKWLESNINDENRASLNAEMAAISRAFKNYEVLGIRGGLIRIDGEVAAYSLGVPIDDEYYLVSVEKGDISYPGIYQVINKLYATHFCAGFKYVNREEDMGEEGLRRAKLSYRPEFLIEKYEVLEK